MFSLLSPPRCFKAHQQNTPCHVFTSNLGVGGGEKYSHLRYTSETRKTLNNNDPNQVCWPAVFVKTMVCCGCSFLQAQKNWFCSLSMHALLFEDFPETGISLSSKNLKYEIRAKKARKSERNREMNLMKMQCCVTPCGQTDVGSSEKTFLAFSRTSKLRHWSKLSTKKFFFSFLALFRGKLRFPAKAFSA